AYACLRVRGVAAPEAALATAFLGTTPTQLLHSTFPESYGPAAASIAAAWLFACTVRRSSAGVSVSALALAVLSFGITCTTVAHNLIGELVARVERSGSRAAAARALGLGLAVGAVALVALTLAGAFPWQAVLADPLAALGRVWWTGNLHDELARAGVAR